MLTLPYMTFYLPAVALLLALGWRRTLDSGMPRTDAAALLAAVTLGAILGARTLMFDFQPAHPGEKTVLGALTGGFLTLALATRALRLDLARVSDLGILPVIWSAALGRVGCFVAGCCHGITTSLPWGVSYSPGTAAFRQQATVGHLDVSAAAALPVHPTQLYEVALNVALALWLSRRVTRRPGDRALLGIIGLMAIRFAVDPLRSSATPGAWLTMVQWSTLVVAGVAALALARRDRSVERRQDMRPAGGAWRAAIVLGAVTLTAVVAMPWLTPLERLVIVPVVLASGLTVVHSLEPRLVPAMPVAGVTAFAPLAFQEPGIPADTGGVVRYVAVGGSAMFGGYEVTTEDCEGNTLTRTEHGYAVGGISAEMREESAPGEGSGIRVALFAGSDNADRPERYGGSPPPSVPLEAVRYPVRGGSLLLERDFRWIGLGIGGVAGQWVPAYDMDYPSEASSNQALPIASLRVGRRTGLSGEFGINTHLPGPVPGPVGSAGLAFGDPTATKFLRFGLSDFGVYVSGSTVSRNGFEFAPFLVTNGKDFLQAGAAVKKRIYTRR